MEPDLLAATGSAFMQTAPQLESNNSDKSGSDGISKKLEKWIEVVERRQKNHVRKSN
jgi:hypothetical protein